MATTLFHFVTLQGDKYQRATVLDTGAVALFPHTGTPVMFSGDILDMPVRTDGGMHSAAVKGEYQRSNGYNAERIQSIIDTAGSWRAEREWTLRDFIMDGPQTQSKKHSKGIIALIKAAYAVEA